MGIVPIILISVLAVIISSLIFFIIKSMILPKRIDALPRLLKQGKTINHSSGKLCGTKHSNVSPMPYKQTKRTKPKDNSKKEEPVPVQS